jgi:hypothetical protein
MYTDRREWGPYLSERQWVCFLSFHVLTSLGHGQGRLFVRVTQVQRSRFREDGDAWSAFPHEHARSRVFRWVLPSSH